MIPPVLHWVPFLGQNSEEEDGANLRACFGTRETMSSAQLRHEVWLARDRLLRLQVT